MSGIKGLKEDIFMAAAAIANALKASGGRMIVIINYSFAGVVFAPPR